MQLSRRARGPGAKKRGFVATGAEIVKRETPLGLYKGLGAVITGIVPKMAIRFTSFEAYKKLLANKETGIVSGQATFLGEFSSPHFEDAMGMGGADNGYSWSGGRCDGSCGRRDADGGYQDPPASPAPQHGGPARHSQIPQRGTRTLHSGERRRRGRAVPGHLADRAPPGLQPGRELHRLHRVQGAAAKMAAAVQRLPDPELPDDTHWVDQWGDGPVEQCAD
jgi:hypothetical protein